MCSFHMNDRIRSFDSIVIGHLEVDDRALIQSSMLAIINDHGRTRLITRKSR